MIRQYPDTATIPGKDGESSQNGDGVIVPGTEADDFTQKGRYEPSTLNNAEFIVDGNKFKLKGIFYMPVSAQNVEAGVDFKVINSLGDEVLTTKVLFFSRGQLDCRVYL